MPSPYTGREVSSGEELAAQIVRTEEAVAALLNREGTAQEVAALRLEVLREAVRLGALIEMYDPDQ